MSDTTKEVVLPAIRAIYVEGFAVDAKGIVKAMGDGDLTPDEAVEWIEKLVRHNSVQVKPAASVQIVWNVLGKSGEVAHRVTSPLNWDAYSVKQHLITAGYAEHIEVEIARHPQGWKLVPVEPTMEMCEAGNNESEGECATYESVYRAMVAAAPSLPATQSAEGRTNSADATGGTVKRFGFDCTKNPPEIIPATNGAFVLYSAYAELFQRAAFRQDEEILEELYWSFDHRRKSHPEDERLTFKGLMRGYHAHCSGEPMTDIPTGSEKEAPDA